MFNWFRKATCGDLNRSTIDVNVYFKPATDIERTPVGKTEVRRAPVERAEVKRTPVLAVLPNGYRLPIYPVGNGQFEVRMNDIFNVDHIEDSREMLEFVLGHENYKLVF